MTYNYRGYSICSRKTAGGDTVYALMEDGDCDWVQRPPFRTVEEAEAYIDGVKMGKYLMLNTILDRTSKLRREHLKSMNGADCDDGVCRPIW